MNERIRELAEQTDIEWLLEHHPKLEKFAELIVRECASVGYDASYSECALNVANNIKKHFGVEV